MTNITPPEGFPTSEVNLELVEDIATMGINQARSDRLRVVDALHHAMDAIFNGDVLTFGPYAAAARIAMSDVYFFAAPREILSPDQRDHLQWPWRTDPVTESLLAEPQFGLMGDVFGSERSFGMRLEEHWITPEQNALNLSACGVLVYPRSPHFRIPSIPRAR